MAKKDCKKTYMCGKMIEPLDIGSNNSVKDFIDNVFGASGYNARRLSEACEVLSNMIDKDTTICLTLAGAMTPIGMSGPIISMMEAGFIDFIISTGANLYHDLHRPYGYPVKQGEFFVDDNELSNHGIARIYDTFIEDDDTLTATDDIITRAIKDIPADEPISTSRLHRLIGENVLKTAPHPEKSILAMAVKCNVPIYTSSPGDSSIAMNLIVPHLFSKKILLDPLQDILETTAIVRESKKNGAIEVGGGSPKNFYMQTQPTLWQILFDNRGGHDYFIQLTVDSPQWGGLSGATPQESKSWGKIKDARRNHAVVYSCASLTFPLLCKYALSAKKPRKLKNIYNSLGGYTHNLKERAKKNKALLQNLKKRGFF